MRSRPIVQVKGVSGRPPVSIASLRCTEATALIVSSDAAISQSSQSRPFLSEQVPSAASRACANHGMTLPDQIDGAQHGQQRRGRALLQIVAGRIGRGSLQRVDGEVGQPAVFDEDRLAHVLAIEQIDGTR